MSYATQSVATSPSLYVVGQSAIVSGAIAQYQNLSPSDKLLVLRSTYSHTDGSTTLEIARTARFYLAGGLLAKIQHMTSIEQLELVRALVANEDIPLGRAYGLLSAKTKFAVWDFLWTQICESSGLGLPTHHIYSQEVEVLIDTIVFKLDGSQKNWFFARAIANMGVDPLS